MRTKVSEFKKDQSGGIIVPFEEVSVLANACFLSFYSSAQRRALNLSAEHMHQVLTERIWR